MREVLFRGKRKDNGEWVYGDLIHRKIWTSQLYIIREEDNGFDSYTEYEVIPETVGQYTGLTDKNGKKIFEGDICRHYSNYSGKNIYAPIVFELGMFYLKYDDKAGMPLGDMCEKIEVIGNIHDNPELLKGGAE